MARGFVTVLVLALYLCSSTIQAREIVNNYILNDETKSSSSGKNIELLLDPCKGPIFLRPAWCYFMPPPSRRHHHHHHHREDQGHDLRGGNKEKPMCESVSSLIHNCGDDFYLDETARRHCCRDVSRISDDCFSRNLKRTERELLSVVKRICSEYSHLPKQPPPTPSPSPQMPSTPPPQSPSPPKQSPPAPSPPPKQSPPASSPPPQPPSSPPKSSPPPQPPSSPPSAPKSSKQPTPAPSPSTPPSASSPPSAPQSKQPTPTPSPSTPPQASSPPPSPPSVPDQPPHCSRPANCLVATVLYDSCNPKYPEANNKRASSEERSFARKA
ncbi:hypothetical protein Pfo_012066 [Paulownia fortunei]|nr:hypothetical protein Pfo_012066 [Paulownia fortunei]